MRRLWWITVVFLCLLAVTVTQAQEAQPATRLYLRHADAIYLIDPSAIPAAVEQIVTVPGMTQCSSWAGNGEWLLISTGAPDGGIYRLNHDSYELEMLLTVADFGENVGLITGCPLTSPDGAWVHFRVSDNFLDKGALHIMNSDSTERRELVPEMGLGMEGMRPVQWSHDSQWIIFYGGIGGEFGYWRIHPDGSDLEFIDDDVFAQLTATVSPDGEWAAYWRLRENGGELWTEHLPDSQSAQIFVLQDEVPFPLVWNNQDLLLLSSNWNDGSLVLRRTTPAGGVVSQVMTAYVDLSLLAGSIPAEPVSWSPDRGWVLLSPSPQLLKVSSIGEVVTVPGVWGESPILWSEDSVHVWYVGLENGIATLYRINVNTREVARVLEIADINSSASFQLGWWPE